MSRIDKWFIGLPVEVKMEIFNCESCHQEVEK